MDIRKALGAGAWSLVVILALAACGAPAADSTPTLPPPSPPSQTPPGAQPTPAISSTPEMPADLEGVLEAEGKLPDVRFYVRGDDGTRTEVMPWLPLEVMHPPAGQTAPPSMASWIGHWVRLHGQWVQSESGPVFQVLSAEGAEP